MASHATGTSDASLPEPLGSGFLHRLTRLLSTYAEDEWFRHRNPRVKGCRFLRVSGGLWWMGFLHGLNFGPGRVDRAQQWRAGWVVPIAAAVDTTTGIDRQLGGSDRQSHSHGGRCRLRKRSCALPLLLAALKPLTRPTEAMVDAAHEAVWFDAFWAINSRADFKKAVRAMIRAALER